MKRLSFEHEHHPLREWHQVPFSWKGTTINLVWYWLEWPPYDRRLVDDRGPPDYGMDRFRGLERADRYSLKSRHTYYWEYRAHPSKEV